MLLKHALNLYQLFIVSLLVQKNRIHDDYNKGCKQLNKTYTNLPIYYYNR